MAQVRQYNITVDSSKLKTLQQKLDNATFPDELDGAGWEYGTSLDDVKRITTYWKNKFDWRITEAKLNQLPNYETTIDVDGFGSLDIHFLHQKSTLDTAIPLLFVHGWPGSFVEVIKLLPLLADSEKNGGPAFHVVAPSLPNFGFSSRVSKPGFGLGQYGETCHKLMLALGYPQYVSQGGDWGCSITRIMGQRYSSALKASHLNLVPALPPPISSPLSFFRFLAVHALKLYTPAEAAGLERSQDFQKSGMGYYHQQTTRPQSIAYALADSPVGLLGWMYEKLHDWTDQYPWTEDEVCTWVSLYWFSRAGPGASVNIYYESIRGDFPSKAGGYIPGVKLGLAYFPKEIIRLPKAWGRFLGDVVYEHENEKGGHFAAWEQPESIAGDLRIMFGKGGGAYGIVEGRSGYA